MNSKFSLGDKVENLEALVKNTGDLINTIPSAADAMKAGDYRKAFQDLIFGFINGKMGAAADEWLKYLYKTSVMPYWLWVERILWPSNLIS